MKVRFSGTQELFNEWVDLARRIQNIASVVQNDNVEIGFQEYMDWKKSVEDSYWMMRDVFNKTLLVATTVPVERMNDKEKGENGPNAL